MNTVATVAAVLTLVMLIIGFVGIFHRFGKAEQRTVDRLDTLEREKLERDKRADKMLDALAKHCDDKSLHVNAELSKHIEQSSQTWREGVDRKLELLLKKE